jgi:hypothetical protein
MFILYHEIILSNFIVKLYKLETTENIVSTEYLDSLKNELNSKTFPNQIIETLNTLQGISQIEIYDNETSVLLLRNGIDIDL